ncbi:MAG: peptide deformylase [Myxococcales bacterium]|nr:peptide deformylase [Myxococcales bacterium]USN51601.1 MAG: peptide deformylase [Myxococcales bacterium]
MNFVDCHDSILEQKSKKLTREEILLPSTQEFFKHMLSFAAGEQADRQGSILVGLAAPQIGKLWRVIIVDVKADGKGHTAQLKLYINPKITYFSKESEEWYEGCYSTAKIRGVVERPKEIVVEALDHNGNELTETHQGYVARIFQHEIDHLDGIRFPQRMDKNESLHLVEPDEVFRYRNLEEWKDWHRCFPQPQWKERMK